MRIGISLSSSIVAETPAEAAVMMVERAGAAYGAGLSSLTVGDHHAEARWYQQNTPILGRLLAEWPDRPAGCLFLLPLWHPLVVAEHIGTLAALVDAPFIVQTGIGRGERQFAAMGADLRTRGQRTEDAIRLVQALLAGEEVESPEFGMGPVTVGLRPAQQVEWWIGGHAPAALRRAAELGTAWYGGPSLDLEESVPLLAGYRDACKRAGSEPRAIVRRDALVLEDGDQARVAATALVERGYRGLRLDQLLVGSPDDAAASLRELADVGYDDVIIRSMSPNQHHALESIELLGELNADL